MALVLQSSGFWIMIFTVLLLLVGCSVIINRPTPAPATITPVHGLHVTPTPYHPPDFMREPFDFRAFERLNLRYSDPPDNRSSGYFEVPTCYRAPDSDYICLGKLWNMQDAPLGATMLSFTALFTDAVVAAASSDDQQSAQMRHYTALEQHITPSGTFAPYRIVLDASVQNTSDIKLRVIPQIEQVIAPDHRLQTLSVTASQGDLQPNGLYRISAQVVNPSSDAVGRMRLVATVESSWWGIVGYQVYEVEGVLPAGAELSFQLDVTLFALPDNLRYSLHAEGYISQ